MWVQSGGPRRLRSHVVDTARRGRQRKWGDTASTQGVARNYWILDRRDVTPAVTMSANRSNRDALWWFSLHGQCPLMGTPVTAGTIFARTRTPLRTWFAAA